MAIKEVPFHPTTFDITFDICRQQADNGLY